MTFRTLITTLWTSIENQSHDCLKLYTFVIFFQLQRIKSELDKMWDNASDEVKNTYTKQYLDSIFQTKCDQMSHIRAVSDAPVIEAMLSSLIVDQPLPRYLVSGTSGGYIDIINVSCWFYLNCHFNLIYQYVLPLKGTGCVLYTTKKSKTVDNINSQDCIGVE